MEYFITGPSRVTHGEAATYTVTLGPGDPGGTTTITVTNSPLVGIVGAMSGTLTNTNRTRTFTYTPPASGNGTVTLTLTNSQSLTNPAPFVIHYGVTVADLSTVVRNASAKTRKFHFLGLRGVTLAPNATHSEPGNILNALADCGNPRKRNDFVRCIDDGVLEIVSAPGDHPH